MKVTRVSAEHFESEKLGMVAAILEQTDPGSKIFQGVADILEAQLLTEPARLPAPTPKGPKRLLTIGASNVPAESRTGRFGMIGSETSSFVRRTRA